MLSSFNTVLVLAFLALGPFHLAHSEDEAASTGPASTSRWLPGLQVGSPEAIAASVSLALFDDPPKYGGDAFIVKATLGLNGGRVAFGRIMASDVGIGAEATVFLGRTWRNPWSVPPAATVVGAEAGVMILAFRPTVGVTYRVSTSPRESRWHVIAGLGLGF